MGNMIYVGIASAPTVKQKEYARREVSQKSIEAWACAEDDDRKSDFQ